MDHSRLSLGRRTLLSVAIIPVAGCNHRSVIPGESETTTARHGEIVETYDNGIDRRNDASETRDIAVAAFNDTQYDEAADAFEAAATDYATAGERFRDAESMATDVDAEAAEICRDAARNAEAMHESAIEALAGAVAGREGDPATEINERIETAQRLRSEAEEWDVAAPETLLATLESDE